MAVKAKKPGRALRVADQIARDIAELIPQNVRDPRVGLVTITGCEITPDYAHAKLFFTTIGCDEEKCRDSEITMAVQVNGKMRGTVLMDADLSNEEVVANAVADEKIAKFLQKQGGQIVKTIVVKNKLVNLIVK